MGDTDTWMDLCGKDEWMNIVWFYGNRMNKLTAKPTRVEQIPTFHLMLYVK